MGRRKKEPESIHRENIALAAEKLFATHGIEATSMDDIARAAAYSKATLYVYFKNKEEIVNVLVLNAMRTLHTRLQTAVSYEVSDSVINKVSGPGTARKRYDEICQELVSFQQQSPFYFDIALGKINADVEAPGTLEVEREIINVGEEINVLIGNYIKRSIDEGEFRQGLDILKTVFLFYAGLTGLINMAEKKKNYIEKRMQATKEEFLRYGFDTLYLSVQADTGAEERGQEGEGI